MSTFDIESALQRVLVIAEQVRASQESSSGDRTNAKAYERVAAMLSDNAEEYASKMDISDEELFGVSDFLTTLAERIGPKVATETWKSDELTATIDGLDAMARLGMLSDEQETLFTDAKATLSSKGKGRASTGDVTTIPGRPSRIHVYDGDVKVSNMSGNTSQSASNLANRLAKLTDTAKDSDSYKVLLIKANEVVKGTETVTIGTISLVPVFDTEE